MGTIQGGEGGPHRGGSHPKQRRPKGVVAMSFSDFLLRLHVYLREYAQAMKSEDFELSAYEATALLVAELAELIKEEYDKRHGQ